MRPHSTYIFLAIMLGLACFVFFINKNSPGTQEQEAAQLQFVKLDSEKVTELELTSPAGLLIITRNGNHWEIKRPISTLAETSAVEDVLSQIAGAQPLRVIPMDSDDERSVATLKDWGLKPALDRVVIHQKGEPDVELLIGRKIVVNDSVYARASGRRREPVRIIPMAVKTAVEKPLSEFRSRNVFEFDEAKIERLATQISAVGTTPGQTAEIDRKNGTWSLQKPIVARASATQVDDLLGRILGLHILDFVTDDASNLSTFGLTSPAASLTLGVNGGPDLALQIGGPVPLHPDQLFALRLKSNSVFTLSKSSVDDLFRAVPNVRDRHVLPFNPGQADGVSYHLPDRAAEARVRNHLWSAVGLYGGPADIGKVTDVLTRLSQLETTPVIDDAALDLKRYGLDKPVGTVAIDSSEFHPGPTLTLSIGKTENKLIYVKNSSESFIYSLPADALAFLPLNNLPLRDTRVINLDPKDITGLIVQPASGAQLALSRSAGGTWTTVNVKNRMVDSVKAEAQASLLSQLQARSWLGPILPAYALDKPALVFTLRTKDDNTTALLIGAPLPDGAHAAQVAGTPIAFVLSEGDYGILNSTSLQSLPASLPSLEPPPRPTAPANPSK